MPDLSFFRRAVLAAAAGSLALSAPALADPVKAGPAVPNELAVVTSPYLSNVTSEPLELDRISTLDGSYKGRIAFPSTGDSALTAPLPTPARGEQLERSADGHSLTLAAANVPVDTSPTAAANAWNVLNVKADGTYTRVPVGPSPSTVPLSAAVTVDGSRHWFLRPGPTGALSTMAPGDAAATTVSGTTSITPITVKIADGTLYAIASGGVYRVAGGGLPASASSAALEQVLQATNVEDAAFVDTTADGTTDTLYVASLGSVQVPAGLYKYVRSGDTWVAAGSELGRAGWVTARAVDGAVEIYTVDFGRTFVQKTVDTADSGAPLETTGTTTLATAPGATRFAGLAFAPDGGFPADSTPYPPAPPRAETDPSSFYAAVGSSDKTSIDFTVSDANTPASELKVTASSNNQAVLPNDHITVTGTGSARTVVIDPIAPGGNLQVLVTVTDADGEIGLGSVGGTALPGLDPTTRYYSGEDLSADIDLGGDYFLGASDEASNGVSLFKKSAGGVAVATAPLPFGANQPAAEPDIEGGTRIGDTLIWTGSHANSRTGGVEPLRQYLGFSKLSGSGTRIKVTPTGSYTRLLTQWKAWDAANGHGLGANFLKFNTSTVKGVLPNAPNGFNVEGLVMAPHSEHIGWFGLRAPTVTTADGVERAVILPVDNLDALAAGNSVDAQLGQPILLDLGGRSIRDIAKNADDQYLISAGPGDDKLKSLQNWALYQWDGNPGHAPQVVKLLGDGGVVPGIGAWEGIVSVPDDLTAGSKVLMTADSGDIHLAATYSQYVTLDQPIPAPAAPVVTATSKAGAIDLSWNAVGGATGYRVAVRGPDGKDLPDTPFLTTDTSTTIEPLVGDTEYTVVVTSQNAAAQTLSAPVKATPTKGPRTPVTVDVSLGGTGILGLPMQLVATLSDPHATGTVAFYHNGYTFPPNGIQVFPVVDGKATVDVTKEILGVGVQPIRAVYTSANTEQYLSTETTQPVVIDYRPKQAALDLTSITGSPVAGQPLTLTYQLRGYTKAELYSGSTNLAVEFYTRVNGEPTMRYISDGRVDVDPATGTATVTTRSLPVGKNRVSAVVQSFARTMTGLASDEIPVTIVPAGTTPPDKPQIKRPKVFLSISGPRILNQPFTLTARVSDPTLEGTVQFLQDGSDPLGSPVPVVDGIATAQVTVPYNSTPNIRARFDPADDLDTTASPVSLTLSPMLGDTADPPATKTATTTTLTVDGDHIAGHALTGTVTVAPTVEAPYAELTIKGYIELTDNGKTVALEHVVAGKASFDLTGLGGGAHSLVAHYVSSDETRATASESAAQDVTLMAETKTDVPVGGDVPATLSLTLGAPATFGTFAPGLAKEYTASTTATVTSTAGDATLTVTDPSSSSPGHLVNGAFALPQPLQGLGVVKSWNTPTANESAPIEFKQAIGANDGLRTGSYSKTLTFTLSTTQP